MKALRLYGPGDLRLLEEPLPVPGAGERLLRLRAVGICGSDLHWFREGGIGDARLEKPLILGHEFSALTEDGRRVAVDPAIPCGGCEFCLRGDPNLCEHLIFAGHGSQDGALRQKMAWPERCLFPLPDSLTDADGVMLEPLGVAIHAVDLAHLKVGMRVGVFGCGPIGLLIVQLARQSGAVEVLVSEPLSHRLEAAGRFGAREWQPGIGVDAAFEVAGENAAVADAVAAVHPGGTVLLAGIPGDDRTSFTASIARRKEITLQLVRRMKHTYPRAIELVTKGLVDVRSIVTHRFPLSRAAEAFQTADRREGLKVVVDC